MKSERRLLSITEAAEQLGLAPVTLRAWIARRKIASIRLGRSVRIDSNEIDRMIDSGTTPAMTERRA